jgi:hypothetical protein
MTISFRFTWTLFQGLKAVWQSKGM